MTTQARRHFGLRLSKPSRVALYVTVFLTLVSLLSYHRLAAVIARESMPRMAYREAYLLPEPEALAVVGMGHNEMMADLVWLKSLSYFAVHFYLDRDYRWLDRYIETIIALDPDFRLIYQWAGVVVMYGGQFIDNRTVMASNRLLEMGRSRYPDDWLLNFMLGINYRYELMPRTREEERTWRLLGATYLRRAAELPGAPNWLSLTALRNLEQYGAENEALAIGAEAFLAQRGLLSATNRADLQLYRHDPHYGRRPALELGTLIANGLNLRERLPALDWWRLLHYRRLLFSEYDTESGYLPWELRTLVRGEPDLRSRPLRTPVDVAFYPTLQLIEGHDDH